MSEPERLLSVEQRAALEEYVKRHYRAKVVLPGTPELHSKQRMIHSNKAKYKAVMCGRRFGKTILDEYEAIQTVKQGYPFGWFCPNYHYVVDPWRDLKRILKPITVRSSEVERTIEVEGGGRLDVWTLDGPGPGRGRKYKKVVIDEAGLVPNLQDLWQASIFPTLTDYDGDAMLTGTPNGNNFFSRCYALGQDSNEPSWASWQMTTLDNPYMTPSVIEEARRLMPDRVFRQEYLAEVIEDAGGVFRNVAACVRVGCETNEPVSGDHVYTCGVDPARVNDFTVITVVDDTGRQVFFDRFNEISWDRIHAAVARAAQQYGAKVVIDATGVGAPSVDALQKMGLLVEPVNITNTIKTQIMDNLAMMFEQNEVSLLDIPVQTEELQSYQYAMTEHGNVRMEAPSGLHDDTCTALALATMHLHQAFSISDIVGAGNVRESFSLVDGMSKTGSGAQIW